MDILYIYGMPRTRTTMALSMLAEGGEPNLFEPFHDLQKMRNSPSSMQWKNNFEPNIWENGRPRRDFLLESLEKSGGKLAVKMVGSQPGEEDDIKFMGKSKYPILVCDRPFREILMSTLVATQNCSWIIGQGSPDKEITKAEVRNTTIRRVAMHYLYLEKVVRILGPNKIERVPHFMPAREIRTKLSDLGFKAAPPATRKATTTKLEDLVENPDIAVARAKGFLFSAGIRCNPFKHKTVLLSALAAR